MTDKPWIVRPTTEKETIPDVQGAQVTVENRAKIAAWCNGTLDAFTYDIALRTPSGVFFAAVGDWILKAPDGTFRVATSGQLNRSYMKGKS